MKIITYHLLIILFLYSDYLSAQKSFNDILESIEINNSTLKAYREKVKADKIGNRVGLNISNPEVEFGYLWGSPSDVGNETDWAVRQSFDFPTVYRYKSQLADGKDVQVDINYNRQAKEILLQARNFCIELVYRNKMQKNLDNRYIRAKELTEGYQKRFDRGDIDILELNKTKLSLLNQEKALELNKVEISLLNNELRRMNGGYPLTGYELYDYSLYSIPVNFIEWFETIKNNNPQFVQKQQDIVLSKKQEQLTKAMNLPKFTVGYVNEYILGTTQQGIIVGVSVPLWENKNTVKHQKAQTFALQMIKDDYDLQFRNELKGLYDKAFQLKKMLIDYESLLNAGNNEKLLKKAFDLGQLSLINYLLELTVYYDTTDKYLETEKNYQLSLAQLEQWEL